MRIATFALLLGLIMVGAFGGPVSDASAVGAEAVVARLDYSGCYPVHNFELCAGITGGRHQVITPAGVGVAGFTVFCCFTGSAGGELISKRWQTEHITGVTRDGSFAVIRDSGWSECSAGEQTCSGWFLLQHADGETAVDRLNVLFA